MQEINAVTYHFGLREPIEKESLEFQANFLKNNFSGVTKMYFRHAFDLAAAGKLNCDAEYYGSWTPQYMARILNAYEAKYREVEIRMRDARRKLAAEEEAKIRAEMFDMEIALSRMLYNAYAEWVDIVKEKTPQFGWVYLWQLRHISETLEKYTLLQPQTILEGWNKNDEESTIILFRRLFAQMKNDLGEEITEDSVKDWMGQFYRTK